MVNFVTKLLGNLELEVLVELFWPRYSSVFNTHGVARQGNQSIQTTLKSLKILRHFPRELPDGVKLPIPIFIGFTPKHTFH